MQTCAGKSPKGSADVSPDAADDTTSAAGALVITFVDTRADTRIVDVEVDADGDVSLVAASRTDETNVAIGNAGHGDDSYDAAVALSFVWSSATAFVEGGSPVAADGELSIAASNDVNAVTFGDAQQANAGAGVGIATVFVTTTAYLDLDAPVAAGSLSIAADTGVSTETSATANAGGASGNKDVNDETQAPNDPDRTDGQATTSEARASVRRSLTYPAGHRCLRRERRRDGRRPGHDPRRRRQRRKRRRRRPLGHRPGPLRRCAAAGPSAWSGHDERPTTAT
jgi:hypothetical protein